MSLAFTSFVFDKPVYNPGDAVTLTVAYTSDDVEAAAAVASAVTVSLSDSASAASQTSDGSAAFPDLSVQGAGSTPLPTTVSASDPRPGTWTLVSNAFAGDAAPFAGTAVLTSVA